MKRVRNYLKREDGEPWPYAAVLSHAVDRIQEASERGEGIYLTAEEIRALDYAVIRIGDEGQGEDFRETAFA